MALKRAGRQTVVMQKPPSITAAACIGGKHEGKGPLASYFDYILDDDRWGEKSWEKAESKMVKETFAMLMKKAEKSPGDIDFLLNGDLLNQCIAGSFGLRESEIPFIGLFGACSTMSESICVGSMLVEGGFADAVACITSSHFCSAEKQFRFPLELGSQRPPSAQWTATASGGVILEAMGSGPYVTHVTIGKIVDSGLKDAYMMGAAMAPAAAATIKAHFDDTGFKPDKYDLILTGDLGIIGKELCDDLLKQDGLEVATIHSDCGVMLYDLKKQDAHSGASGCGCAASVFSGYIYDRLKNGVIKNMLLVATGDLMSPTSSQQGESMPCIAHAVAITTQTGGM